MKYKKIMALLLAILFISCSLSACGSGGKNDVFSDSNEELSEETETEEEKEESEGTKEEETETTKESESQKETEKKTESAEESKTENTSTETKDNKVSESTKTSTSTQETKPAETTPTPHTHNYSSSVTANPTCNSNGTKKYVCSCGDSYDESIPAIGHNFITQYEEVFHESKGEMRQVQVGTSETTYACAKCGATFGSPSGVVDHCAGYVGTDYDHATSSTLIYDGQPNYEYQWIETQPSFTEQKPYNVCSVCGVRQ